MTSYKSCLGLILFVALWGSCCSAPDAVTARQTDPMPMARDSELFPKAAPANTMLGTPLDIPIEYKMFCSGQVTCDLRTEYCEQEVPNYERCMKCTRLCDLRASIFQDCRDRCKGYLDYKAKEQARVSSEAMLENKLRPLSDQLQTAQSYSYAFGGILLVLVASMTVMIIGTVVTFMKFSRMYEKERVKQPIDVDSKSVESGFAGTPVSTLGRQHPELPSAEASSLLAHYSSTAPAEEV